MPTHPIRGGAKVTSGYRTRTRPRHNGTDFRARTGTPLRAAMSGVIARGRTSRAGNWVEIRDGANLAGYSHLSRFNVKAGERVKEGDIIGYSGATGNAVGAHLHFYVKVNGNFVNPEIYLTQDRPTKRTRALQSGMRRIFPSYRWHVDYKRGSLITVDGYDGPQTDAWVREFQRRVGLPQTGDYSWGSPTAWRLESYGVDLPR